MSVPHAVIRTPARPARSQSLYKLRYPGLFNVDMVAQKEGEKKKVLKG
jgi:hypothetical protein